MNEKYLNQWLEIVIAEDLGDGDHTSLACIPQNFQGKAKLLVKQRGILAGIEIAKKIFHKIDNSLQIETFFSDGKEVNAGDIAFVVAGKEISILQAERLVLNIMQRMSGIATQTNEHIEKIKDLPTKIVDTRKTTPGMRFLEKEAVRIGGGENHRFGLFDMILIKDNHIDFAGGIENALLRTKNYLQETGKTLKIEIEARNLNDVEKILSLGGVNRIMLDNFSIENTRKAVKMINRTYEVEASGGITLETIRSYAECGVDFISVGALTHQIKSLDLSLKAF